jgi:hypothetical protein
LKNYIERIIPRVTFEYEDDNLKSTSLSSVDQGIQFHVINKPDQISLPVFSHPKNKFLAKQNNQNYNRTVFDKDKYNFIEQLSNNIKSMYVLNFVQDEDLFSYFKSLLEFNGDINNGNINEQNIIKSNDKYIHMIVQNPINKNESFELGLKVIDVVFNNFK